MNIFARLVLNLKLHIDLYIHVLKYVLYQQNIGIYRYSNIYEIINNRKLKRRWIPKVKNNVHIFEMNANYFLIYLKKINTSISE